MARSDRKIMALATAIPVAAFILLGVFANSASAAGNQCVGRMNFPASHTTIRTVTTMTTVDCKVVDPAETVAILTLVNLVREGKPTGKPVLAYVGQRLWQFRFVEIDPGYPNEPWFAYAQTAPGAPRWLKPASFDFSIS
jgi:hypothetical protein